MMKSFDCWGAVMKIEFVELSGFRGYREKIRCDFGHSFTIIDGRNGVGKSAICDAVEFALTGTIQKYQGAKSDGESVENYLWWRGSSDGPEQRYVEVGFFDDNHRYSVRRTSLKPDFGEGLDPVEERLCNRDTMPTSAIQQLCSSSIIRDELIAALSLDLKETERYSLLSAAIGATGSDELIERARRINSVAKDRLKDAQESADRVSELRVSAVREVDRARSLIAQDREVRAAISRLQDLMGSLAPSDLPDQSRAVLSELSDRSADLRHLLEQIEQNADWPEHEKSLLDQHEDLTENSVELRNTLAELDEHISRYPSDDQMKKDAENFAVLAATGREIGLSDDHCPLCNSEVDPEKYAQSLTRLEETADAIDQEAASIVEQKARRASVAAEVDSLEKALLRNEAERKLLETRKTELNAVAKDAGFEQIPEPSELRSILEDVALKAEEIRELLPIVDTASASAILQSAAAKKDQVDKQAEEAESALSRARKIEQLSKSLHDSARRASGEALNLRLERVLPLIAELYGRLRPHPTFNTIEYKVRGDLRKHLRFRVGEDLNPQFVFSSGQRRAAGLAFLLAVNLSISWSRWKTILLDDPVQHIDDFRSVHLSELLGHLVDNGRQVICAVEDPSLADLICRKMPAENAMSGKRITLGVDGTGNINKRRDDWITPSKQRILRETTQTIAS